jgi:hypothetical protein
VFPGDIEVFLLDGHVFMEVYHVRAGVMVGSSEEMGEEEDHGGMQPGDVAYILEKVTVDPIVVEDVLVELGHYLF